MAIPHATSGQIVDLLSVIDPSLSTKSFALFKSSQLEVIRVALPAGKSFPAHSVPGEITMQCIEGQVEITTDGQAQTLVAGQLMHLAGGVAHGLLAVQDTVVLLTIVLCKQAT